MSVVGYQAIQVLHESPNSRVVRAIREADQVSVVIKTPAEPAPAGSAARFQTEFDCLKRIQHPNVIRPLALEWSAGKPALIHEDFDGLSLDQHLDNGPLNLTEVLTIAKQLTLALSAVHDKQLIHKDVNPANVLWNRTTQALRLIDFGIARDLSHQAPPLQPNLLEGSLAYISPEQTGRMNRAVDYRSDYYSLGATLYELLTGRPPFESKDPLSLVHAHLALTPTPPHTAGGIPRALSRMVLKLMAKTAEARYQSTAGLLADLDQCHQMLAQTGTVTDFEPGQRDISPHFQIPQVLYGRSAEINTLLSEYEQAGKGPARVILVAGFSGVGKSSLVNDIYKPVTRDCGFFVSGKFDQLLRAQPYGAVIPAIRNLIHLILAESTEQLAQRRQRLINALEGNGGVILSVIPELELIIGPQPDPPQLPSGEAEARFHLVFNNFARALTDPNHPVVLFLDDLQWADPASLHLFQKLARDPDINHLLVIGAYRDNEVDAHHPLQLTLDDINNGGVDLTRIQLQPLARTDVAQLLADALHTNTQAVDHIAELSYAKTRGNPLFLVQFLKDRYDAGHIYLDETAGAWRWDTDAFSGSDIAEDVATLLTDRLRKLPPTLTTVLSAAACMGNRFRLDILHQLLEKSREETQTLLHQAMREALIQVDHERLDLAASPDEAATRYRFLHDRIQQVAYDILDLESAEGYHLAVGMLLKEELQGDHEDGNIFKAVNQLNMARTLIRSPEQRRELALLNLQAAQQAKASAAFRQVLNYSLKGLELLPTESGTRAQLTQLYELGMESAYQTAEEALFETLAEEVLTKIHGFDEALEIRAVRLRAYTNWNHRDQAVDEALSILAALGLKLPRHPSKARLIYEVAQVKWAMRTYSKKDLADLPTMEDPHALKRLRFMSMLCSAAFSVANELYALALLKAVRLSLAHGAGPETGLALTGYACFVAGLNNNAREAYPIAQAAAQIQTRFNVVEVNLLQNFLFNVLIRPMVEPLAPCIERFHADYRRSLETGNTDMAAFNFGIYSMYTYARGAPLDEALSNYDRQLRLCRRFNLELKYWEAELMRRSVLRMMGRMSIQDEVDEDLELIKHFENDTDTTGMFTYYLEGARRDIIFGNFPRAVQRAEAAGKYCEGLLKLMFSHYFVFDESMAMIGYLENLDPEAGQVRARMMRKLKTHCRFLRRWSSQGNDTYIHRYHLAIAGYEQFRRRERKAMMHYDKALRAVAAVGITQEEAIAAEFTARFHLRAGRTDLARYYLQRARHAYSRWGSRPKQEQLRILYPDLLNAKAATPTAKPTRRREVTTNSGSLSTSVLDLSSVLKASQAIASEIRLDRLADSVLQTVLENAGAVKGLLLLTEGSDLVIEAAVFMEDHHAPIQTPMRLKLDGTGPLPETVAAYVRNTGETVVLGDAAIEGRFISDPYIVATKAPSILCMPLHHHGEIQGLIYLENHLTPHSFTPERLELLGLLAGQVAISIENARFYGTLEQKIEARTAELEARNREILQTQKQLITQEKMASVGLLSAGVAHELRNPLNFVKNFAEVLEDLTREMQEELAESELPADAPFATYLAETLEEYGRVSRQIVTHGNRANAIVTGMVEMAGGSRGHADDIQPAELIEEFVTCTRHGLESNDSRVSQIQISIQTSGIAGKVYADPRGLSKVIVHLTKNALESLLEKMTAMGEAYQGELHVTARTQEDKLEILFRDNGWGITQANRAKLFTPFFTTKPTGQGNVGLGLSTCYEIVVNEHGGDIDVTTTEGAGAEFRITLPRQRKEPSLTEG